MLISNHIGKTFDEFCEEICSVCKCDNEMCSPLEDSCRFVGDMLDLKKFCDTADFCKYSLLHYATDEHYCFDNPYEDLPHDRDYKFT